MHSPYSLSPKNSGYQGHYQKLNDWTYKQLEPIITPLGNEFCEKYKQYFRIKEDTKSKSVIPEEKQPKLFLAWIAGAVLAAATVALGIKNSRRSHLD